MNERRGAGGVPLVNTVVIGSLIALAGLLWLALSLRSNAAGDRSNDAAVVRVYCAAGVVHTLEQVRDAYHATSGMTVEITRTGGSGELMGQIQAEQASRIGYGADLFVSADDGLVQEGVAAGLFSDRFPLARQRPVIAVRAGSPITVHSLRELIAAGESISFGIAQRSAAIGELTYQIATDEGLQSELARQSRLEAENVMMLAQALAAGSLDAAIVWDSTVRELNRHGPEPVLKIAARLDNNGTYVGLISAGIVAATDHRQAARDFVQFLIAPEGGLPFFAGAGLEVGAAPSHEGPSQ